MPEALYPATYHIEHIIAQQHGGDDSPDNLALCCPKCNRKKGPNLAGVDPQTGDVEQLFHPRRDDWNAHFRWSGAVILGISPTGRATVAALNLNEIERVKLRHSLIAEGVLATG